ncbi:AAA family ATPase [uncultured Amphritea sp.]|uniref:dTMP kinase n=1 Tax=Amphritea sp. TaxID=1872502 RepID=UPI002609FD3D|nr:AAA family ATPase [uncultured Amphritea sp.]
MAFFIVLEALDGVGKTTLAKMLAHHYDYNFMSTPGSELQLIREKIIKGLGQSQIARALFYAATVQAEGEKASSFRQVGENVVMDRYSASTIAYAVARGIAMDLDASLSKSIKPDLTILLTLDEQERQSRLIKRGASDEDLETLNPIFRQRVLVELRQRIDTELDLSGLTEEEALAQVYACIQSHLS